LKPEGEEGAAAARAAKPRMTEAIENCILAVGLVVFVWEVERWFGRERKVLKGIIKTKNPTGGKKK
jgi:hypothetical protein